MVGLRGLEPLTKALLSYLLITRGYPLPPRHLLTTETTIMKKRIIDSMSAQEIASDYVLHVQSSGIQISLLNYLESICKPMPSWKDDVSGDSPVLCYVGDSLSDMEEKAQVAMITGTQEPRRQDHPYSSIDGLLWAYATPVPPNACWKPTNNGGVK